MVQIAAAKERKRKALIYFHTDTLYPGDSVTVTKEIGSVPVKCFHTQFINTTITQSNHKESGSLAAKDGMV